MENNLSEIHRRLQPAVKGQYQIASATASVTDRGVIPVGGVPKPLHDVRLQILGTRSAVRRRQHCGRPPYTCDVGPRTSSRLDFVDPTLGDANRRDDPLVTAALHALPGVLAHVGLALGTFEATVKFSLLELRPHPREWINEVVRA